MKIQDMVCTLEQAKELKELGIEQVGVFSWAYDITNEQWDISHRSVESLLLTKDSNSQMAAAVVGYYSAFTTYELLAMLPDKLKLFSSANYELQLARHEKSFTCGYYRFNEGMEDIDDLFIESGDTPAQAVAKCLIYGLHTKKFTADEANKRLQS